MMRPLAQFGNDELESGVGVEILHLEYLGISSIPYLPKDGEEHEWPG